MSGFSRSYFYKLPDSRLQILDSIRSGQSLIEILIAVAVGATLIIAAAVAIAPSLQTNTQAYKVQVGTGLAKELLENVRVWAEGDWHNVFNLATSSANRYYLSTSSSPFVSATGTESVTVSTTTYTRSFYVDDVYRDASDLIVTSSGSYDPSTKKVSVNYTWLNSATATITQYLTRNRANAFWQSDWSGGPGQEGPATTTNSMFSTSTQTNYSSIAGSLVLTANSASGTLDSSTFDTGIAAGVELNSVLWHGSQPAGTATRFRFATSNSSSGSWSYLGSDGTSNTYYSTSPDVPLGLSYTSHNNKRYFRYRVFLEPNASGTTGPRVDDIIVNWSP